MSETRVTYSRNCELCGEKVTLDLGNSEEAQVAATRVITSPDAFAIVSDALDELMEEHLQIKHDSGGTDGRSDQDSK